MSTAAISTATTATAPASASANKSSYKVAVIQLNCQSDIEENIKITSELIRQAAAAGAKLVCTPENTHAMRVGTDRKLINPTADQLESIAAINKSPIYNESNHPTVLALRQLASELSIYLSIGSIAVESTIDPNKVFNRQLLINPNGAIIGRYDKIHLFDTIISPTEQYCESSRVSAGNTAVAIETADIGSIGLTICYDLRFPHLYRSIAQSTVAPELITVPAAFTVSTGERHWSILLRSRAIENQCYIVAAAQTGIHPGDRSTYGHSMIINPDGVILADAGTTANTIIYADIDRNLVYKSRQSIPSLQHDRNYTVVTNKE